MYIIPTTDLCLLGILNSNLFDWYARNQFQALGDPWHGGRMRFIAQYMEHVPIILEQNNIRSHISSIVSHILAAKQRDPAADVHALEHQIDELVYALYGLTDAEIRIVEGHA